MIKELTQTQVEELTQVLKNKNDAPHHRKYRHSFFILNAIKSSQISRLCPSESPKLIESLFKWWLRGPIKGKSWWSPLLIYDA